jgi:hypothetical protein
MRYYDSIILLGMRKTTKNLSQQSWYPQPPKYESQALPTALQYLVTGDKQVKFHTYLNY